MSRNLNCTLRMGLRLVASRSKVTSKHFQLQLVQQRYCSNAAITSVSGAIERIKKATNSDIVKKVNATYIFDVGQDGKYLVDLKNGEGSVQDATDSDKADVTLKLSGDSMVKMFNRELKPATAFMSGKLKLSGDMGKAMKLENLLNAKYHTWNQIRKFSVEPPPLVYESVEHVFERLKVVASPEIVKKVQAVFLFDVQEKGKYFIDFKGGDGKVGEGDPDVKPDVTISMNNEYFLKIFNREVSPATAFMTGKIKVKGDLSKALTLEKVMVAAREAAMKEQQK